MGKPISEYTDQQIESNIEWYSRPENINKPKYWDKLLILKAEKQRRIQTTYCWLAK